MTPPTKDELLPAKALIKELASPKLPTSFGNRDAMAGGSQTRMPNPAQNLNVAAKYSQHTCFEVTTSVTCVTRCRPAREI
mmetsp:Transcript_32856/g.70465  ORF Transcript_32856/g.70465 Transcript_32856/m.70465 type:complete len:80 (+) Transcript_32856:640-879(+)